VGGKTAEEQGLSSGQAGKPMAAPRGIAGNFWGSGAVEQTQLELVVEVASQVRSRCREGSDI